MLPRKSTTKLDPGLSPDPKFFVAKRRKHGENKGVRIIRYLSEESSGKP
jgi:hypothetical protein